MNYNAKLLLIVGLVIWLINLIIAIFFKNVSHIIMSFLFITLTIRTLKEYME